MRSGTNRTKRRRGNDDEDVTADEVPSAAPPAVVSSSPTNSASENTVSLTAPVLDEIPKLLMDLPCETEEAARNTLEQLWVLIGKDNPNNKENGKKAASCGPGGFIIQTLRKWQHNHDVQHYGVRCLVFCTLASSRVRTAVLKMGGIEAVVDAMKIFSDHEVLVANGLILLGFVYHFIVTDPYVQIVADRFVNEFDGIAIVTKALKKYIFYPNIQVMVFRLFHNLALRKELRKELKNCGAVSAVVAASKMHPDDEVVQSAVSKFMKLVYT